MGSNRPFAGLGSIGMSADAEARFSARLAQGQKRAYRVRKLRYGICALASLAVCAVSAVSVSSALSQAGAYDFIALAFRDAVALSYSKELFLSVAESLPVMAVASLLAGLLFSGLTLPRLIRRPSPLYA